MNYVQTLRSPRRRLTVVAAVVLLHLVMIYGWFNLKLYGGDPHRGPALIRVDIVHDARPAPPAATPATRHDQRPAPQRR